jgi:hypothetical protein
MGRRVIVKPRDLMDRLRCLGVRPRLLKLRHGVSNVAYRNGKRRNMIRAPLTRGVVDDRHVDGGRIDSEGAAKSRTALALRLLQSSLPTHLRHRKTGPRLHGGGRRNG